jgi:AcrR family transcriptional regulator
MPLPPADRPTIGLRERKKAKTRAAIQQHALRLFRAQGYAGTTVDQIAEAAEVSPSTFFRYFPTKEDVVLYDEYDPQLLAAFDAQPPELPPLEALRAAIRTVMGPLPAEQRALERDRGHLLMAVPELRARALGQVTELAPALWEAVARRAGRTPDDAAVRTFVGALLGVAVATMATALERQEDYLVLMDEALGQLEAGLPL